MRPGAGGLAEGAPDGDRGGPQRAPRADPRSARAARFRGPGRAGSLAPADRALLRVRDPAWQ